jgi:hypothetical protein
MAPKLDYPHIEKALDQPAHLARIPRVRVAQIVMNYLAHGWSPDEMCRQHLYLTPAEAHSAMAYSFDHQDEIDAEIYAEIGAAESAHAAAQNSSLRLRLRAKGLL